MADYQLAFLDEDSFATDGSSEYGLVLGSVVAHGAVNGPYTYRASHAFDIKRWMVNLSIAPGASKTYTAVLNIAGSDVATVAISGTDVSGEWTGTASVAQGDLVYWHYSITSGGSDPTRVANTWAINTSGGIPIPWSQHINTTANRNFTPGGRAGWNTNSDAYTMVVVPVAGTLQNMYVRTNANVPAGTLAVGSRVASSGATTAATGNLAVSITAGNSTGQDTSNSDSLTAGQQFCFRTSGGSSALNDTVAGCVEFVPTTSGDGVLLGSSNTDEAGNGATEYIEVTSVVSDDYDSTEANKAIPMFACTIDKLYVRSQTAPAGSDTEDVTLTKNGSSTSLTVQLTTTNSGSDTSNSSVLSTDGDTVSLACALSATAAATSSRLAWGMRVTYTPPAAGGHPAMRRLGAVRFARPVEVGRSGVEVY